MGDLWVRPRLVVELVGDLVDDVTVGGSRIEMRSGANA